MIAALLLALVPAPAEAPPTDVWPQWRGPTGDSVVPSAELPLQWGPKENVAWKVKLPGWGASTPAIWRDAVFLTTQENDDRLLAFRLERGSGQIVWQREVGRGSPKRKGPVGNGRFHDEHNMATPSPVTDGEHVWFHFGNGDLACYDFAGTRVWAVNLKDQYGPYSIWWGHANSPVLVGELLISICVQDPKGGGKSYVVALDKRTGKERWLRERQTGATSEPGDAYTTPIVFHHKDHTELIVFGGNVLDAYDPATGKSLWQCKSFNGNRVISGPTLAGDVVYAVQGMRGPLFAVKAGGSEQIAPLWKYTGATPDAACPVAVQGLVFLATNNGVAVCIDAATGQELWKERLADGFRATPLVVGNKVYFFGKDGRCTVVAAARQFEQIARSELGEDITASPAAAGHQLFVRTKDHVYCIGGTTSAR